MAVADFYSPTMTKLTGNTSGAIESLPNAIANGGKQRTYGDTITLASQASGKKIAVARIPVQSSIVGFTIITDTSLSTATLSIGDMNSATQYAAAATFTATDTPTRTGKAVAHMTPITSGYDATTGLASTSFTDIVLTVGVAALPASGNLVVLIDVLTD